MACASCKKKELRRQFDEMSEYSTKYAVWFLVIWSGFAIYGIYSLVTKFL